VVARHAQSSICGSYGQVRVDPSAPILEGGTIVEKYDLSAGANCLNSLAGQPLHAVPNRFPWICGEIKPDHACGIEIREQASQRHQFVVVTLFWRFRWGPPGLGRILVVLDQDG
jgi:hypothetical protein